LSYFAENRNLRREVMMS